MHAAEAVEGGVRPQRLRDVLQADTRVTALHFHSHIELERPLKHGHVVGGSCQCGHQRGTVRLGRELVHVVVEVQVEVSHAQLLPVLQPSGQ